MGERGSLRTLRRPVESAGSARVPRLAGRVAGGPVAGRRLWHRRAQRDDPGSGLARRGEGGGSVRGVRGVRARAGPGPARKFRRWGRPEVAVRGGGVRRGRLGPGPEFRPAAGAGGGRDDGGGPARRQGCRVRVGLRRRDAVDAPLLGRGRDPRPGGARPGRGPSVSPLQAGAPAAALPGGGPRECRGAAHRCADRLPGL